MKFFQKARNFRSFLGYIGVPESENALSFAELALVFNKIFSLGPKFLRKIGPKLKILVLQWTNFFMENWSALGPKFSAKDQFSKGPKFS